MAPWINRQLSGETRPLSGGTPPLMLQYPARATGHWSPARNLLPYACFYVCHDYRLSARNRIRTCKVWL